jgi:ABC-type bacteriocin/lantibiotic exporter with double-glycine peptidase domain
MKAKNLKKENLIHLLSGVISHIGKRRKYQYFMLLMLTIVGAVAEIVSLSAVVPFIAILINPNEIFSYEIVSNNAGLLGIYQPKEMLLPLTIIFLVAAITAGAMRVILLWVGIKIGNSTGADLGTKVFKVSLNQPYSTHIDRNGSEIISGITQKVNAATGVLISFVIILTASILFLSILITLLFIDPKVAIIVMLVFGSLYFLIAWFSRKRLRRNSKNQADEQTNGIRIIQEALSSIRDVIIGNLQNVFSSEYDKSVRSLQKSRGENSFINQAPRFIMESLGIVMIAVISYVLSANNDGSPSILPTMGALALGAQRLLPLLQQIYGNWSVIKGSQVQLFDVVSLLDSAIDISDVDDSYKVSFQNNISMTDVSFKHEGDDRLILKNINLTIEKGKSIGIVGSTGSGKSTLLDLLMCLIRPFGGALTVDNQNIRPEHNKAWQKNIAHVPQDIFLIDATIMENIAFGTPKTEIDTDRVKASAFCAQISSYIEDEPLGYNTIVGEGGIKLSGGQKQRIGIARALYRNFEVLFLDEATSALDSQTERAVIKSLESLHKDLTLIMIAHRISSLQFCDAIIVLDKGSIVFEGSYEQYVEKY